MSVINEVFLVPILAKFGIQPRDPTFGRYLLPNSQDEQDVEDLPYIRVRSRRVFISRPRNVKEGVYVDVGEGEDVSLTQKELDAGHGKEWIFYKIWESDAPEAVAGKARGCDLVLSHGMGDYGGKWSKHAPAFLAMGFRLVIPDLASHGRSTGVHVHLQSAFELTEGIHAVLTDLARFTPGQRKTFLSGSSLGGWTSLAYALRYPQPPTPIAGLFLIAPLIGIAPETFPPYPIYLLGLLLRHVAGRLALDSAVKGNVSEDPRVEAEFFADDRCYHGDLRIATGLALLEGLDALLPNAASLSVPLRIAHGSKDRATDHKRSIEFVQAVLTASKAYGHTADAQCQIYDEYEHVMLKVGVDAADDAKRQAVLGDMVKWFGERL